MRVTKVKQTTTDHILYMGTLGLMGLMVLSGAVASSIRVNAEDNDTTVSTASVTVAASCSMTATLDTPHNATLANGIYSASTTDYADGIGKTTIATFCNDNSGYAIYAIGYTGDKYDGEDHTKLIGATNGQKITTSTATSGDTSSWAMKLTKVTDSSVSYNPEALTIENGYDDYNVIPDTYTKVANYTSTTDQTLGSVLSTTYAAYISGTQVADTYAGKVKYTLVHPHTEIPSQPQTTTTGLIKYYANVSDAVGTMNTQNVSSSVTLLPSNFSRTGYGFAGWSDKFDYATNPEAKFYGPNETIALNTADYTGTNPGLSLYAVWVKSQGNLQDSTKVASVCNSLDPAPIDGTANLSSVSALTDQRDNNTYAIAKLADGKCWMIENMRLDNTNSDNSTGALAQGYATNATYGNFAGLANPESPWANNITTANSLYSTDGADDTINIGTSNASYRFPRYNNQNTSDRASAPATGANTYSYGNYYTWAAAIADLNNYTSNNASVANTSICPSGWRLPTGGQTTVNTTADFYTLGKSIMKDSGGNSIEPDQNASGGYGYYGNSVINTAGKTATAAIRSYPNNFLYSGYVYSGSVTDRGSGGGYWSSTANGSYYAYSLYLGSSNVDPGTFSIYKYYGRTIRCLMGSQVPRSRVHSGVSPQDTTSSMKAYTSYFSSINRFEDVVIIAIISVCERPLCNT